MRTNFIRFPRMPQYIISFNIHGEYSCFVTFQFLKAASMKSVFWDVAPCSLVEVYRRFRGAYCFHHQGDDNGVANTSKTSVNFYQTTRRNILEDSHLYICFFYPWISSDELPVFQEIENLLWIR
jgi:hypothetical protein